MALTFRLLLVLALLALPLPAVALTFDGRGEAIDGDTLHLSGRTMRLFGIDAPELDQTCDRGGKKWACGVSARDLLADILSQGRISCEVQDIDRYGREVAVCVMDDVDIGARMVRSGAAIAYRKYSQRYVNVETAARHEGAGLWSARWITPEEHRHGGNAQEVPKAACAIKGNIGSTGKHIYHLPGQADYAATKINPAKGERWFCSEAEARAAGFRRAAR